METIGIIVVVAFVVFLVWKLRKDKNSSDGGIIYPPDRDNNKQEER